MPRYKCTQFERCKDFIKDSLLVCNHADKEGIFDWDLIRNSHCPTKEFCVLDYHEYNRLKPRWEIMDFEYIMKKIIKEEDEKIR